MSNELVKLSKWFAINKLSPNMAKINVMVFSNHTKTSNVTVHINDTNIEMVYVNTFLAVLIDNKLKWEQHVKMITSKLSKTIAIMNRTKYILDKNARLILYYSLFLPYMSYCCEVWGNTSKTNIECMYLLQKKVVRIVCGVGYREHTNELFSELRILKLIDIVKLRSACIMYKAHRKLLPNNLLLLISLDSDRGHITRQNNTFKQLFARITLKSQCISVQGIKLWNSLENSIKSANNILMFRKLYKRKIFLLYRT